MTSGRYSLWCHLIQYYMEKEQAIRRCLECPGKCEAYETLNIAKMMSCRPISYNLERIEIDRLQHRLELTEQCMHNCEELIDDVASVLEAFINCKSQVNELQLLFTQCQDQQTSRQARDTWK